MVNRFGHLVDLYAWSPHCLNLDGVSSTGKNVIGVIGTQNSGTCTPVLYSSAIN